MSPRGGEHNFFAAQIVLKRGKGVYVGLSGDAPQNSVATWTATAWTVARMVAKTIYRNFFSGFWFVHAMCWPSTSNLNEITCLIESKKIKPVIAEKLSISEIHQAFEHMQNMHANGKVVVTF